MDQEVKDDKAPAVDYGDAFTPVEQTLEVELTAEEVAALGLKEPEKEATDAKPKEADKKADPEAKEAKTEEEPPRDRKGQFIPKARFDELNVKAKAKVAALEARIKAMSDRLAPLDGKAPDVAAIEASLDSKEDEYGKLLADGELDKAKAVLKDINRLNRQLGSIEATSLASTHAQESTHVDALGQMVDLYKESYPVFDDANKDAYNQDLVNFVADLQGRFEMTGSSPAEALRMAVELTVSRFGLVSEAEAPVAEAAKTDKKSAEDRKAASVAKAVKAANAQPPKLDKAGTDSDKIGISKIDVFSLSQEEFNRLPESTLARLRGDHV